MTVPLIMTDVTTISLVTESKRQHCQVCIPAVITTTTTTTIATTTTTTTITTAAAAAATTTSTTTNTNDIERRSSRFCAISSLRCKLSPTRALERPGRDHVQLTCNAPSSVFKFDRVEIAFVFSLAETTN